MGLDSRPQNFKPGNKAGRGTDDMRGVHRRNYQGLSPRAERFAHEYVIDMDGPAAVTRAGFNVAPKNLGNKAAHLLAMPRVAALVAELKAKQAKRLEIKADRVLLELARMAYFDPGEIGLADINSPADIAKLPEDVRMAIAGWSWDKNGNFTLKLAQKQPALDSLGRHLKLFVDRVEVKDVTDRAQALARARARVMQGRTESAASPAADPALPAPG